ncbi:MAG TPA: uL22 family ribosomal protein [archaeon]|nr:uL22 family ribosomal protein [archaeon]
MKQTFTPKHNYAKATGVNLRISKKASYVICNVIRGKPLTRAKRLLEDLAAGRRALRGKYYSKTVKQILLLLNSCEKNAEFKGLDMDRLFVHASAHKGSHLRRRRRKGAFGTDMKSTNMEIMLIEKGKQPKDKISKKKIKDQLTKPKKEKEVTIEELKEKDEIKKEMTELKMEQKELQKDVEKAKEEMA